jgi:hypothetical protein
MDKTPVQQDLVAAQIKITLDEIFAFCSDACDARQSAHENSAEWHKRTGEILAYARMTALLSRLEKLANPSGRTTAPRTFAQSEYTLGEITYVVLSVDSIQ